MTPLLRAAAIGLAALLLVAASGCGGDTKAANDYVDAVNKAQTDFQSNVQKMGSASNTGSDPAAAAKKTFGDLSAAILKVINDLKAVDPPGDVENLHNELIGELEDFGHQVDKAGASLSSGDPTAILKAQSTFATEASKLGTKISQTIADINTKLHD